MRYLRIGTSTNLEGLYGPIDIKTVWPMLHQLRPLLIGRDALAGEHVWDLLERVDRHARHGYLKMAISAVDNALWDVRGKIYAAPVWQLLGGGLRREIPAYASMLGTTLEIEIAVERARWAQASGFAGQKWFLAAAPADGAAGLTRNVEVLRAARTAIGPDSDLMIDVFRGWDLPYTKGVHASRRTVRADVARGTIPSGPATCLRRTAPVEIDPFERR